MPYPCMFMFLNVIDFSSVTERHEAVRPSLNMIAWAAPRSSRITLITPLTMLLTWVARLLRNYLKCTRINLKLANVSLQYPSTLKWSRKPNPPQLHTASLILREWRYSNQVHSILAVYFHNNWILFLCTCSGWASQPFCIDFLVKLMQRSLKSNCYYPGKLPASWRHHTGTLPTSWTSGPGASDSG